jgi:surfeit locus 1 family protein
MPALATVLAGAVLIGLGLWQLHRLAWKEAIIATIDTRAKAPPVPLPPADLWPSLKPADYAYRHVTFAGRFLNDRETLVLHAAADGPGYLVLTPLELATGGIVLVNRGFVPLALKDPSSRAAGELQGEQRVTGLMREPEPRNLFTPADEPDKGQFFTRDPAEIAAHWRLRDAAPFTVDADATPNPGGWPRGATTEIDIPNNHLSYALTWFGLAFGLFGVFVSFAWTRFRANETSSQLS